MIVGVFGQDMGDMNKRARLRRTVDNSSDHIEPEQRQISEVIIGQRLRGQMRVNTAQPV